MDTYHAFPGAPCVELSRATNYNLTSSDVGTLSIVYDILGLFKRLLKGYLIHLNF